MKTLYICAMIKTDKNAANVAEFLLQIKAIEVSPQNAFTWASGLRSPIYCDNRKILSYPQIRTYVRQQFAELIGTDFGKPEVIAGVATGGIALGALVAQELGLPFIYVRSEAKGHGLNNRIEGVVQKGQSVLVIEDLVSTGKSSLSAVEALREAELKIMGMAAVFSYGFAIAAENFLNSKVDLITLSDYPTLINVASELEYIDAKFIPELQEWRKDPKAWSERYVESAI